LQAERNTRLGTVDLRLTFGRWMLTVAVKQYPEFGGPPPLTGQLLINRVIVNWPIRRETSVDKKPVYRELEVALVCFYERTFQLQKSWEGFGNKVAPEDIDSIDRSTGSRIRPAGDIRVRMYDLSFRLLRTRRYRWVGNRSGRYSGTNK
jgi:hypothetical protein